MEFDELKDKRIVLFGAGYNGVLILDKLLMNGINPLYFVDNFKKSLPASLSKQATEVPVNPPKSLLTENTHDLRIIITPCDKMIHNEIKSQITEMGLLDNIYNIRTIAKGMCIDIINKCNLSCPTCARGNGQIKSTQGVLDTKKFREIVKKGKYEGYSQVGLYNWTEPFLVKNLEKYVCISKEEGMRVRISSNLSLNKIPHLESTLRAGVDELCVSVSGYYQDVYQINHKGGKIEVVFKHLRTLSRLLKQKKIDTSVNLRFIKFQYNHDCEEPLQRLAEKLGISFHTIPGTGNPLQDVKRDYLMAHKKPVLLKANEEPVCGIKFDTGICNLLTHHVAINHEGNTFLCCCYPNHCGTYIGKYIDLNYNAILSLRYLHPKCKSCNMIRVPITNEEQEAIIAYASTSA